MRLYLQRKMSCQRGSSYIEFLIVAPILLLVAGSTIELARFVRFRQIADVISKEAALEAYRVCDITDIDAQTLINAAPRVNTGTSTTNIQNCLNNVANKYQATVAATGIANATVILSIYRYDFGNLVPQDAPACSPLNSGFTQISTSAANSGFTLVGNSMVGNSIQNRLNGAVVGSQLTGCQLGRVLISELAFFYAPIINFRVVGINNSFDTNFNTSPLRRDPGNFQNAFRETTIL
jgi:Flp pilus assembly protein TadG